MALYVVKSVRGGRPNQPPPCLSAGYWAPTKGSVVPAHLPAYLNEYVFRFNRRTSRSRGMLFLRLLELAVDHDPVRYQDLVADPKPKPRRPSPPAQRESRNMIAMNGSSAAPALRS